MDVPNMSPSPLRPLGALLALALLLPACNGVIDPGGTKDGAPAGDGGAHDLASPRGDASAVGDAAAAGDASTVQDAAQPIDAADPCQSYPCQMGKRCVPQGSTFSCVDPCAMVSCSAPEMCFVYDVNGTPLAMDAYGPIGTCLDPCANVTCASNQACVPSAHGVPLGACVDRCDCSNCGNCGANGTFVGEQAFCGNPNGSPATMACNVPCAGGGCIPWDSAGGICWPLEGCFSL
jgi:hypothetical protein